MAKFLNDLLKDPRYKSIRDVLLFIIITILIHFCYKFWIHIHYYPIGGLFERIIVLMEHVVLRQTWWVIVNVLQTHATIQDNGIWLPNHWGIIIGDGCTGLKQIIQVLLLFLIYPGPWKHKAWFIPAGMIIVHLTNIVRITLLAIAMNLNLPNIHFIHDQILRFFFYVVIFGMWMVWEEKIVTRNA